MYMNSLMGGCPLFRKAQENLRFDACCDHDVISGNGELLGFGNQELIL